MGILRKTEPDQQSPDWRDDPALTIARQKLDTITRTLAEVERGATIADEAMHSARERLEDMLLSELLERASKAEVDRARHEFETAETHATQLTAKRDAVARAVALLRQEIAPLEADARKRAWPVFRSEYEAAVKALAEAANIVEARNQAVKALHAAGRERFGELMPGGLELPALYLPELLHNPNTDHGGRLGRLQWRIGRFLDGLPDVDEGLPAEGNWHGETDAERDARRQRAAQLTGRR